MQANPITEALHVTHRTQYDFDQPVILNPHYLMLYPRQGHEVTIESFDLRVSSDAKIHWMQDVLGNQIAVATFSAPAKQLIIESVSKVHLLSEPWPIFQIDPIATSYPFRYDDQTFGDLGPFFIQRHADPDGKLREWAHDFVAVHPTDTLSLLKSINSAISSAMMYESRDREGTQSPAITLARQKGTCRDFAVLFAEAARSLGLGARIISGYLNNENDAAENETTHAWSEVFLPGAGWIAFDPTNNRMGGFNLLPVAVACDIRQLVPVAGSFAGAGATPPRMTVEVVITKGAPQKDKADVHR